MKINKLVQFFSASVLAASVSFTSASAESLTIAGSSTVKPIVEAASKGFKAANPGVKLVIGGGGSSTGVKNAAEGKVMLGMASRKVKSKESSSYPDIKATPVGQDGIAIIVHKSNPIASLSKDQVQKIFTGQITNWNEVGGSDSQIMLNGHLTKHGTSSVFTKYFGLKASEEGTGKAAKLTYTLKDGGSSSGVAAAHDGNQPACASVLSKKAGISFSGIGFAQSLAAKKAPIKLIVLDGVEPNVSNVVSGSYKLARPLQVITKGDANGITKKFIDYLLSPDVQAKVKEMGYIPVNGS